MGGEEQKEKNQCGSWETPGSVDDKLEFLILPPASCPAATYQCIIPEQTCSVERDFWLSGCTCLCRAIMRLQTKAREGRLGAAIRELLSY